jgi:GxxExxY protein
LSLSYEGLIVDVSYRLDVVVDDVIVVEVKAVEALTRIHQAQLLTYLRLSRIELGFLMNFNVEKFKDGVRRLVL